MELIHYNNCPKCNNVNIAAAIEARQKKASSFLFTRHPNASHVMHAINPTVISYRSFFI
jgi:hypothetical protein